MTVEILGLQLPGNPQNVHQELFFAVISPGKWIKEVPAISTFRENDCSRHRLCK